MADTRQQSPFQTLLWIPIVALAAWVFISLVFRNSSRGTAPPGLPLPPLVAEAWLNGPPPDDVSGKVVVLDAWGSYCGPCAAQAPEMVQLYKKFHDRGVVFVGFSSEDESAREAMQNFLDRFEIAWPNGYGADAVFDKLNIFYIPATFVFGKDGKLVWNDDTGTPLEDAIEQALAE